MIKFCSYCHHKLSTSIVEVTAQLQFCSDKCLEHYFSLYAEEYNNLEKQIRDELSIDEVGLFNVLAHLELCESVLNNPLFSYTAEVVPDLKFNYQYGRVGYQDDQVFIFLIYTVVGDENIFIYVGASRMLKFMQEMAKRVASNSTSENFPLISEKNQQELLAEFEELLEGTGELDNYLDHKKNGYIAQLLEFDYPDKANDYSFEEYESFAEFFEEVLNDPDELYCWEDDEGDRICSYTKVLEREGIGFYYVVLGISIDEQEVFPFLSFPTKYKKVVEAFQKGEKKLGNLQN